MAAAASNSSTPSSTTTIPSWFLLDQTVPNRVPSDPQWRPDDRDLVIRQLFAVLANLAINRQTMIILAGLRSSIKESPIPQGGTGLYFDQKTVASAYASAKAVHDHLTKAIPEIKIKAIEAEQLLRAELSAVSNKKLQGDMPAETYFASEGQRIGQLSRKTMQLELIKSLMHRIDGRKFQEDQSLSQYEDNTWLGATKRAVAYLPAIQIQIPSLPNLFGVSPPKIITTNLADSTEGEEGEKDAIDSEPVEITGEDTRAEKTLPPLPLRPSPGVMDRSRVNDYEIPKSAANIDQYQVKTARTWVSHAWPVTSADAHTANEFDDLVQRVMDLMHDLVANRELAFIVDEAKRKIIPSPIDKSGNGLMHHVPTLDPLLLQAKTVHTFVKESMPALSKEIDEAIPRLKEEEAKLSPLLKREDGETEASRSGKDGQRVDDLSRVTAQLKWLEISQTWLKRRAEDETTELKKVIHQLDTLSVASA